MKLSQGLSSYEIPVSHKLHIQLALRFTFVQTGRSLLRYTSPRNSLGLFHDPSGVRAPKSPCATPSKAAAVSLLAQELEAPIWLQASGGSA